MRAKVERAALGPWLSDEAREARENLAKSTFAPEQIREACTKAAQEGFSGCTIKPPLPLNLRGTDAVKVAEAWLESQGLTITWEVGRDTPDGTDYPRLHVSWP